MKSFNDHKLGYDDRRIHLSKHSAGAIKSIQFARADAFSMVEHYLAMEELDADVLLRELKIRFPVRDPFDAMIREDFAPLLAIGEDPYELLAYVRGGGSRKEYLRSAVLLAIGGKKRRVEIDASNRPTPTEPSTELPLDRQVEMWKQRARSLQEQVKRLREVERENAQLRRRISRIEKILRVESAEK